jgi:very-short-patch-repair endonuclease
VYLIAGGPPPTRRSKAFAAVLWAGEGSVASHGTAAAALGIANVRASKTEVTCPPGRDVRSSFVQVHRAHLDVSDQQALRGLPITTPARTVVDIAGRLEDSVLLATVEDSFRRGICTPEQLGERLAVLRGSGRPGTGRLAVLLGSRVPDARALESVLEAKLWLALERSSLPRPQRQFWITADGDRYRLDFAWPEHRVVAECDGWAFHGGRDRFERDALRRARVTSIGWRVIPVTWAQVTSAADAVVTRIERALALAA